MAAKPPSKIVLKVCRWIASEVKRPKRLPNPTDGAGHLRWTGRNLLHDRCCPLGLLSSATCGAPYSFASFDTKPPISQVALYRMMDWWDSVPVGDRAAAMDVVWPPAAVADPGVVRGPKPKK